MALVNCRECSSEVSASAETCPRCGVSAPAGMVTLTFIRSGTYGRAERVEVFVDQKPFGKVEGKPGIVIPVTPGSHHVELRTKHGKSTVAAIQAAQGNTNFTVTISAMGSPKFQ